HDERESGRRRRRAPLAAASKHEQGRSDSAAEREQHDEKVTPHQPTTQIVHPRPHEVQQQHASRQHLASLATGQGPRYPAGQSRKKVRLAGSESPVNGLSPPVTNVPRSRRGSSVLHSER